MARKSNIMGKPNVELSASQLSLLENLVALQNAGLLGQGKTMIDPDNNHFRLVDATVTEAGKAIVDVLQKAHSCNMSPRRVAETTILITPNARKL